MPESGSGSRSNLLKTKSVEDKNAGKQPVRSFPALVGCDDLEVQLHSKLQNARIVVAWEERGTRRRSDESESRTVDG
jgi:hypothetical protein